MATVNAYGPSDISTRCVREMIYNPLQKKSATHIKRYHMRMGRSGVHRYPENASGSLDDFSIVLKIQ
jgi:hypothetical protein